MMTILMSVGIMFLLLLVAFWMVFRRLFAPAGTLLDPRRVKAFAITSYAPLKRLLCEEDYVFLRQQRGFEPGIEKTLRERRRRVVRKYLRSLGRDFMMLHMAARVALVHSATDRPELASALVRQNVTFWYAMAAIEIRLTCNQFGLAPAPADLSRILAPASWMQEQLRSLTPRMASASAAA